MCITHMYLLYDLESQSLCPSDFMPLLKPSTFILLGTQIVEQNECARSIIFNEGIRAPHHHFH